MKEIAIAIVVAFTILTAGLVYNSSEDKFLISATNDRVWVINKKNGRTHHCVGIENIKSPLACY